MSKPTVAEVLKELTEFQSLDIDSFLDKVKQTKDTFDIWLRLTQRRGLFPQFKNPIPANKIIWALSQANCPPLDKLYAEANAKTRGWILAYAAAKGMHLHHPAMVEYAVTMLAKAWKNGAPAKPDLSLSSVLTFETYDHKHLDMLLMDVLQQACQPLGIALTTEVAMRVSYAMLSFPYYARHTTVGKLSEKRVAQIMQAKLKEKKPGEALTRDELRLELELNWKAEKRRDASPVRK